MLIRLHGYSYPEGLVEKFGEFIDVLVDLEKAAPYTMVTPRNPEQREWLLEYSPYPYLLLTPSEYSVVTPLDIVKERLC